jgi:hypothetical protein
MRQNALPCAQSPVGAEPVNAVQIGGSFVGTGMTVDHTVLRADG